MRICLSLVLLIADGSFETRSLIVQRRVQP